MKGAYFTMKEIKKLNIILSVIDKKKTGKEAALLLNLSQRQIWRLVSKIKTDGNIAIKHKNHFNKPSHALSNDLKDKIYNLKISSDYCDTNFTHFNELLKEKENIFISYSTTYNILTEKGIISKRKHRKKKTHRMRKRKEHFGELIQTDGTPYDWFKNGNKYSLHGYIDDATGMILALYMCESECLMGYLEITRQLLLNYGIPQTIYSDRYSVFFPAVSQKISIEEQLNGKEVPTTQFHNILDYLGIKLIAAGSSQAKGRIERLWNTLQDRLVTEFKLNNIKTIKKANEFLISYINSFNKKFAKLPANPSSAFIPLPNDINLDLLLTSKLSRVIDNGGTFTIKNKRFQIINNNILPKTKVQVLFSHKIGIKVLYKDIQYDAISIDNIPYDYSTLNSNKLTRDIELEIKQIATNFLSENSKAFNPILTSS